MTTALVVALGLVAACDGGGDDDDDAGAGSPSVADAARRRHHDPVASPPDDGRLTIGLLLPRSGDGAAMGQSMSDAANRRHPRHQRRRRRPRRAGRGGGRRRGRDRDADAADAMQQLIDAGRRRRHRSGLVDRDVGRPRPAPGRRRAHLLPHRHRAGPRRLPRTGSVRAHRPERLPAGRRPGPAGRADRAHDGGGDVARRRVRPPVGGGRRRSALEPDRRRSTSSPRSPSPPDGSPRGRGRRITATEPGVVVVVADADHGGDLLQALAAAVAADSTLEMPEIIVNDAMRIPNITRRGDRPAGGVPAAIQGLAPVAEVPDDLPGAFATNAFDCATLIALAAAAGRPGRHDPACARRSPSSAPCGGRVP